MLLDTTYGERGVRETSEIAVVLPFGSPSRRRPTARRRPGARSPSAASCSCPEQLVTSLDPRAHGQCSTTAATAVRPLPRRADAPRAGSRREPGGRRRLDPGGPGARSPPASPACTRSATYERRHAEGRGVRRERGRGSWPTGYRPSCAARPTPRRSAAPATCYVEFGDDLSPARRRLLLDPGAPDRHLHTAVARDERRSRVRRRSARALVRERARLDHRQRLPQRPSCGTMSAQRGRRWSSLHEQLATLEVIGC